MSKETRRNFIREMRRIYDPATSESYKKTHKPLFSKPEEPMFETQTSLNGSTPATPAQIKQVLYTREE